MQEYMLLIRNRIDHQTEWPPEKHGRFLKACELYINDLKQAGKLISAQPLVREGTMLSGTPGVWKQASFTDAPEVIVGYYHILAADQEDAVSIAKGNPEFAYGTSARIEVRPVKMKEEKTGFVYPERK